MSETLSIYLPRLLLAMAVGGIIGLEREFHGKPAGIRTNILMCVGSCLIMIISIEVAKMSGAVGDPARIAAQVVTGVGFLCAGTIIRSSFTVSGLTTAATIWVLSALGLTIGAGFIALGLIGALLITVTLVLMRYLEAFINRFNKTHIIQIMMEPGQGLVGRIVEIFSKAGIRTVLHEADLKGEKWTITIEYNSSLKNHGKAMKELSGIESILSVSEEL
ncbi:MAG: MgtC/SapB family protein [Bacteroidales bacterium]|nr:MgtC/SapB family protein [Candidatus Latescibacterota bacterium]